MQNLPDFGLTLHWPWSTAITDGPKRVENRNWRPGSVFGSEIAIHCGKTRDDESVEAIRRAPDIDWAPEDGRSFEEVAGCIVGTALVVGYIDDETPTAHAVQPPSHVPEAVSDDGSWNSSIAFNHVRQSPWWGGPIGWILDEVKPLDEPIPARGQTGLWSVEEQIEEAIDRCGRCGRPDGRTVRELDSGAWCDADGQWHGSQGLELDLIPKRTSISESTVDLETVRLGDDESDLCRPCQQHYGVGTAVDSNGQRLLV